LVEPPGTPLGMPWHKAWYGRVYMGVTHPAPQI